MSVLPCWKIYPGGVIYVADYIHKQRPDIHQHLLTWVVEPSDRKRVLKEICKHCVRTWWLFHGATCSLRSPPEDDALASS